MPVYIYGAEDGATRPTLSTIIHNSPAAKVSIKPFDPFVPCSKSKGQAPVRPSLYEETSWRQARLCAIVPSAVCWNRQATVQLAAVYKVLAQIVMIPGLHSRSRLVLFGSQITSCRSHRPRIREGDLHRVSVARNAIPKPSKQ